MFTETDIRLHAYLGMGVMFLRARDDRWSEDVAYDVTWYEVVDAQERSVEKWFPTRDFCHI